MKCRSGQEPSKEGHRGVFVSRNGAFSSQSGFGGGIRELQPSQQRVDQPNHVAQKIRLRKPRNEQRNVTTNERPHGSL